MSPYNYSQETLHSYWSYKIANNNNWKKMETVDCPEREAMRSYSEERTNKDFVGWEKATIVTKLDGAIRRTKEKHCKTSAQDQVTEIFVKILLV